MLILSTPEREPQVVPADATSRKPILLSSSSSENKNIIMPGTRSGAYLGGLQRSRGASVVWAVYLGGLPRSRGAAVVATVYLVGPRWSRGAVAAVESLNARLHTSIADRGTGSGLGMHGCIPRWPTTVSGSGWRSDCIPLRPTMVWGSGRHNKQAYLRWLSSFHSVEACPDIIHVAQS